MLKTPRRRVRPQAVEKYSVARILEKKACCGCGACVVACPHKSIRFTYGLRYNYPAVQDSTCFGCSKCIKVCPSAYLVDGDAPVAATTPNERQGECHLVHSTDDSVRFDSASGGFITGLLLHLMETERIDGAIVCRCQGNNPLVADSFIARDRETLLSARGSKYAPVSNCTSLREVIEKPGRYVFVGTPCMIDGLRSLQDRFTKLEKRVVLCLGLVCGGMASRLATRAYIEGDGGVNVADVRRISYRGNGWPGRFMVFGDQDVLLMDRPYIGGLAAHVVGRDHYLRCYNCPDHWSRLADITISDPWSTEMMKTERKGRSAIMLRTEAGKQAFDSAIRSGVFNSMPITSEQFLGYNAHLVVGLKHAYRSWMDLYQLLFRGRLNRLAPTLQRLMQGRCAGLRTTLRIRLTNKYYY